MDFKNLKIRELVRSYKEDGYLNIFILGQEGSGNGWDVNLVSKIFERWLK